jgi:outer membrane protein TolC
MALDRRRQILRNVREQYLEIWYQQAAAATIKKNQALFTQLVDVTESQYAAGRATQQDVLRAELELSRLQDKLTRILGMEETSRATLARWIGDLAMQALPDGFPELPDIPQISVIRQQLVDHPLIQIASAKIETRLQMVGIAEEQYKPAWNVGVEYRKRFGNEPNGSGRADMMAAMATVSIPIFTDKRQDRRLAASKQRTESAKFMRVDKMRELRQMLDREHARWLRLDEREKLYKTHLIREARASASASLNAYQSGVSEFTSLMRARITALDVQLESLRLRIDKAQTTARLLYLSQTHPLGVTP